MKNDEFEEELRKALDLYSKGRLSAEQKAQLDKELDDLKVNGDDVLPFTGQDLDDGWRNLDARTRATSSKRVPRWFTVAAAALVVAMGSVVTLWLVDDSADPNKRILADGSIVWLKDEAVLGDSEFTLINREVSLRGEALFEVAKDHEHPFTIHCGEYKAMVLGTSFNIKSTDSTIELTVLTGQVKLSTPDSDSAVIVRPREHVVFKSDTRSVDQVAPGDKLLTSITKHTDYDMYFEDTRMDEIVRRIERKFDVKVELDNRDLLNCMISADFTDQSLTTTLTMISEALGTVYHIDGGHITISGVGCME